jgi:hypothetical protein
MAVIRQAHPAMGSRWREFIEQLLPWFDPRAERQHDRKTEQIRLRSISARIRAERVIDEYRRAAKSASRAGERMIDETRRAGDGR